jgi:hypothetical protein
MIHLLAANTATPVEGDQLFLDILPWLGLILLLVVILVVTIYVGRRMVRSDQEAADQPFTLQSLRDLHQSGQLSDEEFERARDAMIGRVKAAESDANEAKKPRAGDLNPQRDQTTPTHPDIENASTDNDVPRPDHADNNDRANDRANDEDRREGS